MSYNGWTNRATWNVALWAGNDEPMYRRVMAGKPYNAESAEEMGHKLFGPNTPDGDCLDDANWEEIAEAWNE